MKRYKLLKDLAGLEAGSTLYLNELGNLVADDKTTIVFLANFIHHYNLLDSDWFEEIPECKRWRAEEDGQYWFMGSVGEVYDDCDNGGCIDDRRYELGNYFKTEEEAQKASDWLKAFAILRDDTKGFKPDWGNGNQGIWSVEYDHDDGTVSPNYYYNVQGNVLVFANKDDAEESIKAHERQWRIYYGVEE